MAIPNRLLSSLTVGLVNGAIGVIISISYAALIFSGNLSSYVSAGVGIVLFSATVIRTVVALMSSFSSMAGDIDELPSVILALIAASIVDSMPASASPEEILLTILSAIALTSLLTGAFLLALGLLKLGELIRFIPYPVIGGFVASTGWLMVQGSIEVMTDAPVSFSQLPILFQSDVLIRWVLGLIFAVMLLVISSRYTHYLIMPASLLTAIGLFYVVLWLTNTSVESASAQGWLLGPFPQKALWQPLSFSALTQVNWSVIFNQIGSMMTIMVSSAASVLLTASGVELITEQDIDMNRELQAAGLANLASGLGGGVVGYHELEDSVLAYTMGARSRLTGLFTAVPYAAVLVLGPSLLSFFPKPILGSLLLFFGLVTLNKWIYDAWFKLPRADYFIVLLILVVTGLVGFVQGVGVGLFVAVVLFVINYSRINVTRHVLSGADHQSNVARPQYQNHLLREQGDQIYILELQGFIFFGTANNLLNQIRQRTSDLNRQPLRFVVLDFRLVSGFDSSAVISFVKMKQIARKHQLGLVFTALQPTIQQQLQQGGCIETQDPLCQIFPDLDRGIEWCEDQILKTLPLRRQRFLPLALQLTALLLIKKDQVPHFMHYLEQLQIPAGQFLFHRGDSPDGLYFVEYGQVSILLELDNGQTKRLHKLGAGTVFGEMELYQGSPRSASAFTDKTSTLYCLSREALQTMQRQNPELAAAFHQFVVRLLADRLAQSTREVQTLLQ